MFSNEEKLQKAASKFSSIPLDRAKDPEVKESVSTSPLKVTDTRKVNVVDIVNSLIADEFIAWYQYYFMKLAAKGKSLNFLNKIFNENGEDELDDHLNKLVNWMQSKDYKVEFDVNNLLEIANCKFKTFVDNVSTLICIDTMIESEDCAIDGYDKAYKLLNDKYPELGQIFMEIKRDEMDHKKLLQDIKSSTKEYSVANFSARLEKLLK